MSLLNHFGKAESFCLHQQEAAQHFRNAQEFLVAQSWGAYNSVQKMTTLGTSPYEEKRSVFITSNYTAEH